MAVNSDKPTQWKRDIEESVDFYNEWFLRFAPKAYRETRERTTREVELALKWADNLKNISEQVLRDHPTVLRTLRMATAPPIARDRLIGLSGVSKTLVSSMEDQGKIPPRMGTDEVSRDLASIGHMISRLLDSDIFPWIETRTRPGPKDVYRAATIVADRLCGAVANPIIRNAQERRQLNAIGQWLRKKGYTAAPAGDKAKFEAMAPGTFGFRVNVPVTVRETQRINIPVDVAIMPRGAKRTQLPLLVEAKSAGDFTNVNKRRKEEAIKVTQLRRAHGKGIRYILFLCGYFDTGYLGYEAAEGIDWVWEHRIDDLDRFGL